MNEDGTPIDNGGQAPAAPAAPADNGGVPAAPAPAPAPAAPAQPQAPADPTIQPGQSPTDLDFESMLDELDAEIQNEDGQQQPPADQNNPDGTQPPADPNNPDGTQPPADPNAQQPQQPQNPENQPPANPAALPQDDFVELNDYERYFNVEENEELGIRPIGEIRNPEPGESAQEYYKSVTLPAIIQTVQNMTGFATHNQQVTQRQQEAQAAERDTQTIAQIDNLIKQNLMPAYQMQDGSVDPNSEGGKVIGEVLKMATEYNSKPENANNKITSFDHAFRALYQPAKAAEAKEQKKNEQQQRRAGANAVLNGGRSSNGAGAGRPQAATIRKGQSVTDLNFEDLLG